MNEAVRRILIGGSIVALCANIPSDLKAQAKDTRRFQRASVAGRLQTTFLPRGLNRPPVTVVAVLGGPSVADVQETAGRRLTRQEKDAVKAQRRAEQTNAQGAIQGLGGRIIGSYQSALNGIKVRIPADRVAELRALPGVVEVRPVTTYKHENVIGVPRIQAPLAWAGVNGVRGEGVKVAIIDTGIDFTHANFGGPGTPAAYDAAFVNGKLPADPALFGPNAPKVKGGTDLVGDDYDADGDDDAATPHPDPNPLDCNGHGSHVAGTAAGFGVVSDGTTFAGPYDQLTYTNRSFIIGPGVAPKADLYAVRVFGCEGSTNVVTEAIDWAVDNDMDAINMSLGSPFGDDDSADALASDNAMKAGVMVVMSAGNEGNIPYIAGSPGVSRKGVSVAATVNPAFFPTANLSLPAVMSSPAKTIVAINANGAQLPGSLTVKVLRTATGGVSLGCDPAEYVAQNVTGKVVVVVRGTCARVARAIYGQQAGAAAVVMINNTPDLPPFEGQITVNPDTGDQFTVSIPFLGVRGTLSNPNSDGSALVARDGLSIGIAAGTPIQTGTASFSSSGPRLNDAHLKPDLAAPGEAVTSTLVGSGNQGVVLSGTSMAAPFVTGTSALVIQAHPRWKPAAVKSALMNSGNPNAVNDYRTRRLGAGLINAAAAVGTEAYAFADRDEVTLNFGLDEFRDDLHLNRVLHIKNDSGVSMTFNVAATHPQGSPHSISLDTTTVTVPARGQSTVSLTFILPAATAGDSSDFRDAAGVIAFTPASSSTNRGIGLSVPYYMVPRVSANVTATLTKLKGSPPSGNAVVENRNSPIDGTADFYAWGLESGNDRLGRVDVRAAGVQSLAVPGDRILVFAINTFKPWSAPSMQEFDVLIDSDDDGQPDFDVFSDDFGLVVTGEFSGEIATFVLNLHTGDLSADFDAVMPTDASTILLPVFASSIAVTSSQPRFSYTAAAFDLFSNDSDQFDASARFNAFNSAISNGQFEVIAPNATVSVPVSVNSAEFASTPAKGLMIVTQDDKNGAEEANLLKVKF